MVLSKNLDEVRTVIEAAAIGDLVDPQIGVQQKFRGGLHPKLHQVGHGSYAGHFSEVPQHRVF